MNPKNFGERLIYLRKKNQLSQAELGELIGVSNKVISKWENGYCDPKLEELIKLKNIFKVSMEYLTLETEEEKVKKRGIFKILLKRPILFILGILLGIGFSYAGLKIVERMNDDGYADVRIYELYSKQDGYSITGKYIESNYQREMLIAHINISDANWQKINAYTFDFTVKIGNGVAFQEGDCLMSYKKGMKKRPLVDYVSTIWNDNYALPEFKDIEDETITIIIGYFESYGKEREIIMEFGAKRIYEKLDGKSH